MLRAISCIHIEGRALRRKDFFKVLRMCAHSNTKVEPHTRKLKKYRTTVLSQDAGHAEQKSNREHPRAASASVPGPAPRADGSSPPPPPPPPPPPRSRRALTLITALTFTASLGGVYLYRKMAQEDEVMENKADNEELLNDPNHRGWRKEDEGCENYVSSEWEASQPARKPEFFAKDLCKSKI
ncbi:uncharacterized protein LOC119837304 [Zerene cesonia]|uniref:uncharacterized protein LOC119837304 n=1 Tax=Zerene cesonia TaxID=33412 RepID=UPI0018E5001A|nr:uncharacterized protein LOC119837304 [Zerene cesonia]